MSDNTNLADEPRKGRPQLRLALRRCSKVALVAAALICGLYAPALHAATRDVVFYGSVTTNNQCAIVVNQTGVLGVSGDQKQLSSKLAGGRPGTATVTAFGSFRLSAVTPSVYTIAPNGADTNVTRQVLFSGVKTFGGGATFTEHDASIPERINGNSRTDVTLNFIGTRTGAAYPTGRYQAVVVLRCE